MTRTIWIMAALLCSGCGWELQDSMGLTCGDGKKADEEACDGAALGAQTCAALGHGGGTLACTSKCKLDTSGCYTCGDEVKARDEICDGAALGGKKCTDHKDSGGTAFAGGTLKCKADCSGLDTSGCFRCGDGTKNGPELCDGTDLGSRACKDLGFEGGTLKCKADCGWFETSGCYKCGDGKITGTDTCDGTDLDKKICVDRGYEGGELKCNKDCTFNEGGCYKCGDNKITGTDKCDGADLGVMTCAGLGYLGGKLACKKDCTWFDPTGCYKCGDNKINGADLCDGTDIGSKTCKALGWEGGTLACKTDCSWFDEAGCYRCGDKKKNGAEQCDAGDLGSATCGSAGFVTGTLKCNKGCTFDTSGCAHYSWAWASQGGGGNAEETRSVAVDSAGNVYVVGTFVGSAAFGTTTLSAASSTATSGFVAKLDASGKHVWAVSVTGTSFLTLKGVAVDSKGDIYVGGQDVGQVTLGTLKTQAFSQRDFFVAKLSSAGTWQWVTSAGSPAQDAHYDLQVDAAGNSYLVGNLPAAQATFGTLPKTASAGGFVARADPSGKFLWVKVFPGSTTKVRNLAVDSSGNVHLIGEFDTSFVLDGAAFNVVQANQFDLFVAKLNSSGALVWARSGGSVLGEQAFGIGLDAAGNTYVAGEFAGPMTLGATTLKPTSKFGHGDRICSSPSWMARASGSGSRPGAASMSITSATWRWTARGTASWWAGLPRCSPSAARTPSAWPRTAC